MPDVRTYRPDERPDVLVLVDDHWHQGELRQWSQDEVGAWWGQVQWRREAGLTFITTFPADKIREDSAHPNGR